MIVAPGFRPSGRLSAAQVGVALAAVGVRYFATSGGEEALVVFAVEPNRVIGYDARGSVGARLAAAWYRTHAPRGGPLLGGWLGEDWGVVVDARWARWFRADVGLRVRVG